jgi:AraC-like DNA-binding protein
VLHRSSLNASSFGPSVDSIDPQSASIPGRAWVHPIAQSLGATIRRVGRDSRLECRWMQSRTLDYAELNAPGCECVLVSPHTVEGRSGVLLVVLQQEGEGYVSCDGHSFPLRKGEWAVLTERAQYRSTSQVSLSLIVTRIAVGDRWQKGIQSQALLRSTETSDGGIFVREFIRSLSTVEKASSTEELYLELSQALLLVLTFSRDTQRKVNYSEYTLTQRIRRYVTDHIRDPDLNLDQMAASLQCSKRSLHKAFSSEGISVSEYIWSERLLRCKEQLEDLQERRQSITEIALSWGFSTPSHFSTMFKARFRESPRAFRNRSAQLWLGKSVASEHSSLYVVPHQEVERYAH